MNLRNPLFALLALGLAGSALAAGPSGHLEIGYDRATEVGAGQEADGIYAGARIAGPAPYEFFGALNFASLKLDPGPDDYERLSFDLGYQVKASSALRVPVSLGLDRFRFATDDVDATSLRLGIEASFDRKADLSVFVGYALRADNDAGVDYNVNEYGVAGSLYFSRQLGLFARYRSVRFNPDGAGADFETREAIGGLKVQF